MNAHMKNEQMLLMTNYGTLEHVGMMEYWNMLEYDSNDTLDEETKNKNDIYNIDDIFYSDNEDENQKSNTSTGGTYIMEYVTDVKDEKHDKIDEESEIETYEYNKDMCECLMCEKKSNKNKTLNEHMDYAQVCKRNCKCDMCVKSYDKNNSIIEHMKYQHGNKQNYK